MLPQPPRDEMPQIQGPARLTMPVMRLRVIEGVRVTLTQYKQYANCSEMDLIVDLVDKDSSTYLGHMVLQAAIPGYRVWGTHGQTSQHALLMHYIVGPCLPESGFAGLAVNIFAFSTGMARLQENQGRRLVEIPKLQRTL